MSEQTPSISITDALQLFLQLVNPSGLSDGPEKDALLEHMRARVAADRPEWAATSAPPPIPFTTEGQSEYAQTKAAIVAAAQAPEIPTDPMERAIWMDAQQARQNAEQRRADASDDDARERLRRRAIDDEHEFDEATLGRALRIRRMLELELEALALRAPTPSLGLLDPTPPALATSNLEFSQPSEPEPVMLTVADRVELMQAYNAERRKLLHCRQIPIPNPPRDSKSDERMQMSTDKPAREREGLAMDSARSDKRKRTWDLQLD